MRRVDGKKVQCHAHLSPHSEVAAGAGEGKRRACSDSSGFGLSTSSATDVMYQVGSIYEERRVTKGPVNPHEGKLSCAAIETLG